MVQFERKITIGNLLTIITVFGALMIAVWRFGMSAGRLLDEVDESQRELRQVQSQVTSMQKGAAMRDDLLNKLAQRLSFVDGEVNDGHGHKGSPLTGDDGVDPPTPKNK